MVSFYAVNCMIMMLAACSSRSSETQNDSETGSASAVENQPVTENETDVQECESDDTSCSRNIMWMTTE